jgi:hypothetical protein
MAQVEHREAAAPIPVVTVPPAPRKRAGAPVAAEPTALAQFLRQPPRLLVADHLWVLYSCRCSPNISPMTDPCW